MKPKKWVLKANCCLYFEWEDQRILKCSIVMSPCDLCAQSSFSCENHILFLRCNIVRIIIWGNSSCASLLHIWFGLPVWIQRWGTADFCPASVQLVHHQYLRQILSGYWNKNNHLTPDKIFVMGSREMSADLKFQTVSLQQFVVCVCCWVD